MYNNEKFQTEKYIPRRRIIQCYKCWKYGHIANLCPHKQTCVNCSKNHETCEIANAWQYKYTNCGEHHVADSKLCRIYKDHQMQMLKSNEEVSFGSREVLIQDY